MDNEEKHTMLHCSEFFRLRGRIFGLVDEECLEEYAGQNHVAIFEVKLPSIHHTLKCKKGFGSYLPIKAFPQ